MRVLLIGASGATGQVVLDELLQAGHAVTAFVRNPAAFRSETANLRVAPGEARDAASLARAMQGQDAALSTFGPRSLKADDLQEALMTNLVAAMKAAGVRRLVNLSAAGVGDSRAQMPFLFGKVIIPLLLGRVYADKARGEAILFASGLDYVNVRPGRLSDRPARGGVKAQADARGLKLEMTRSDLAAFMVAQLTSDAWLRRSPIIGY